MPDVQHVETPGIAERRTEFRQLMGLFTTGVSVISIEMADNSMAAMTVNSFVSVSLDPMLVSWSLQNSSSQFDLYASADRFAVSILANDQAELAQRYASRGDSQLREDDFIRTGQGLPVIAGALGFLECRRWSDYLAGDHTMIFGEVTGLSARGPSGEAGLPLGFFNGQFCGISK